MLKRLFSREKNPTLGPSPCKGRRRPPVGGRTAGPSGGEGYFSPVADLARRFFCSRENWLALALCLIVIVVVIMTSGNSPQWIYQGF